MNISDFLSILSVVVSLIAIYIAFTREQKTLKTAAADRALQRFNRINERLLEKPELNRVFKQQYASLKQDAEAKTFIWYIFNQLEGTYLDHELNVLKSEYFKSYDEWLRQVVSQPNSLRDFIVEGKKKDKLKNSFSTPYWSYLQELVDSAPVQLKPTIASKALEAVSRREDN